MSSLKDIADVDDPGHVLVEAASEYSFQHPGVDWRTALTIVMASPFGQALVKQYGQIRNEITTDGSDCYENEDPAKSIHELAERRLKRDSKLTYYQAVTAVLKDNEDLRKAYARPRVH